MGTGPGTGECGLEMLFGSDGQYDMQLVRGIGVCWVWLDTRVLGWMISLPPSSLHLRCISDATSGATPPRLTFLHTCEGRFSLGSFHRSQIFPKSP